jgi:hypothetical protein
MPLRQVAQSGPRMPEGTASETTWHLLERRASPSQAA